MNAIEKGRVESEAMSDFARIMQADSDPLAGQRAGGHRPRINLDQDKVKNGLGQVVLTLVKLLHELLERQAIRRMDSGSLTDAEVERIGLTLMQQAQTIERLRKEFGLEEEDLNLDLGPLGKLL
jgi:mRNA-degrading endonuclease toxin of MazEF toxin-antitoxin module